MAERGTRRTLLIAAGLVLVGLLIAACAENAPQDTLQPLGSKGEREYDLFVIVFWVAVAVFILVEGLLLFILLWFRQRRRREHEVPVQVHGNTRLELMWTAIPALILAGIAGPTVATIFDLSETPKGPNVLQVRVIGHQWWWEFQYPDLGVVTANEVHMPAGRPVHFQLESADVIHSFWIPRLGGKQDVTPGHVNRLTLSADTPGAYPGQCVEFCGLSHANMRLRAVVHSEADFQTWVTAQQQPALTPASPEAVAGQEVFLSRACIGCHTIEGTDAAGRVGPDLTHFASRTHFAGAIFERTDASIAAWLRNPPAVKPGALMPNLALTEDEISKLVAYLQSLQ